MRATTLTCVVSLVLALWSATGCARSPEAQKARSLERGDTYARREQYREAVIEYLNVLRYEPANPRAIRQLGVAYFQMEQFVQAFRYLLKAQELAPDDLDVRLKLGTIYLGGGKLEQARSQATYVLGKEPRNVDALGLLADTCATPDEIRATIQRLEEARSGLAHVAKIHLALGVLYLRQQDISKAEQAFQEAAVKDPKSVEAHILLGSFYLTRRDMAQAEREFKTAAELAPVGLPARMKLADFYLFANRHDEAKRILRDITQKAPDFLPAWRRMAEIAFLETNYEESIKTLQALFKRNPSDRDGHL